MKTHQHTQQRSQNNHTYSSTHPRVLLKVTEYSFYVIAGLLAFYSATPWLEVGIRIGSEIAGTKFYSALVAIPFLGLIFSFLRWFLVNAFGVGLWAIINLIQVTPTLLAVPPIYEAIVQWLKSQRQPDSDNPQIAKYQKKRAEWLMVAFKEVGKFAAISYLLELAVNVAYFMPYQGGWSRFLKDAPFWSLDKILFVEFGLMLASILAIEILFKFVLTVWRIFRAIK